MHTPLELWDYIFQKNMYTMIPWRLDLLIRRVKAVGPEKLDELAFNLSLLNYISVTEIKSGPV